MAAACALEHVDLLDVEADREKIDVLLKKAVDYSGGEKDILQLCTIGYLKIGNNAQAMELLRILVNEQYNLVINAQILSGLYVSSAVNENSLEARSKYDVLAMRVNHSYLIRMPSVGEEADSKKIEDEFYETQKNILSQKFNAVIGKCMENLEISLGKKIPASVPKKNYPDYYFSDDGKILRIRDFRKTFSNDKYRRGYIERLFDCGFIEALFVKVAR